MVPRRPIASGPPSPASRKVCSDFLGITSAWQPPEYRHRAILLDHSLAGKCPPQPYHLVREPNQQGQKRRAVATELSQESMSDLEIVDWLRYRAAHLPA